MHRVFGLTPFTVVDTVYTLVYTLVYTVCASVGVFK